MLLYYITDRKQFAGGASERHRRLIEKIGEAAAAGVDFIQLRERDLPVRNLEALSREAVTAVKSAGTTTRLLINSRVDVALAVGADGVHLRSTDIAASDARAIAASRAHFAVTVSCHTVAEVESAWSHGADFAVFAPVFEKEGRPGAGLKALRVACKAVPNFVFALGGVTKANASDCAKAGAAGIAGIRMYQTTDVFKLVQQWRGVAFPEKG